MGAPTIRPPKLRSGDQIGIVSPSWPGAALYPHRLQRGIEQICELGFEVKVARHALNQRGFVSDTAENRVADLHEMFLNPDVRVVLTAIGGDHSSHLLPQLDFELIRRHPKIFIGYSDTTVLSVAIWRMTGVVTFYGPALLTDFAEYPQMFSYTRDALVGVLSMTSPYGALPVAAEWTDELLDWGEKRDLSRPRHVVRSQGWTWLKPGISQGVLVGGCLESLQHLRGTRFWPDLRDSILFFEVANVKPDGVDAILMDYENMGAFESIRGLLVGRSWGYTTTEHQELRDVLLNRTAKYAFPIVCDMDFGHTSPQLTLPIGCVARIDAAKRVVEITEASVS
jgi:muramoyltetrapeptide carboxypeptidase